MDIPHLNSPRVVADMFDTRESPTSHDEVTTTNHVEIVVKPFIEHYRASIKHVMSVIEKHITQSTCCGKNKKVHPPSPNDTINDISSKLRKFGRSTSLVDEYIEY